MRESLVPLLPHLLLIPLLVLPLIPSTFLLLLIPVGVAGRGREASQFAPGPEESPEREGLRRLQEAKWLRDFWRFVYLRRPILRRCLGELP